MDCYNTICNSFVCAVISRNPFLTIYASWDSQWAFLGLMLSLHKKDVSRLWYFTYSKKKLPFFLKSMKKAVKNQLVHLESNLLEKSLSKIASDCSFNTRTQGQKHEIVFSILCRNMILDLKLFWFKLKSYRDRHKCLVSLRIRRILLAYSSNMTKYFLYTRKNKLKKLLKQIDTFNNAWRL